MDKERLIESKNKVESDLSSSEEILRDANLNVGKYDADYIKAVKSVAGMRKNVLAKIESELASLDAE